MVAKGEYSEEGMTPGDPDSMSDSLKTESLSELSPLSSSSETSSSGMAFRERMVPIPRVYALRL